MKKSNKLVSSMPCFKPFPSPIVGPGKGFKYCGTCNALNGGPAAVCYHCGNEFLTGVIIKTVRVRKALSKRIAKSHAAFNAAEYERWLNLGKKK